MWERNMFLAMQGDNVKVSTIQKLIHDNNGFDLNSEIGPFPKRERGKKGPKFHTALTWAAWQGNLNLVKFIISEGANPQKLTSQGLAAIHCCSMRDSSDNLAVVKYLLEHPRFKINVNFCSSHNGITPLMHACSCGAYNIAEYLLQEQNAEVNQQDNGGKSAFFHAVRGGHLNLAQLLVAHNASVCLRDNSSATALHHLMIVSSNLSVTAFWDLLTYLVDEKGLSVLTPARDGSTALHEACRSGLTEVVGYLIRKGANLEAKKHAWETPLWSSVMGKSPQPELVGLLLEKGANFEARHCLGFTLSQYAKQVSKDLRILAALDDAQRVLRANRMKTLLAKRRAILSFNVPTTSSRDCVLASDPFCYTFTTSPVPKAVVLHTAAVMVPNDVNSLVDELNLQDDRKEMDACDQNIMQNDVDLDKNSAGDDVCSSISSGSFQSESYDEGEDVSDYCSSTGGSSSSSSDTKDFSGSDTEEGSTEKLEEDNNDDELSDEDHIVRDATTTASTVETILSESSFSSSCDDDDDDNGNGQDKNNDPKSLLVHSEQVDGDITGAEQGRNNNDDLDTAEGPVPSSSSSSSNTRDFDVGACFERLLRKKRLLEQQLDQSFEGTEKTAAAGVPKKIKCVRRITTVSLSSDSD